MKAKRSLLPAAPLTGLNKTGQGATALEPVASGYVDQRAAASAKMASAITDIKAMGDAGYMKHTAHLHNLKPCPAPADDPNLKKAMAPSGAIHGNRT